MNKLVCGGAEKSLISVLETMITLNIMLICFYLNMKGFFIKKLPKEVTLVA